MASPPTIITILPLLILLSSVLASGSHLNAMGWIPAGSGFRGTVGECLNGEEEFDLVSESTRRILATNKYISYGALQRNSVPCSRRGTSYYNCKQGAQANPYSRGCSAITRCRS